MLHPHNCQYYCVFILANMYAVIMKLSKMAYEVFCDVSQITFKMQLHVFLKNYKIMFAIIVFQGCYFLGFQALGIFKRFMFLFYVHDFLTLVCYVYLPGV